MNQAVKSILISLCCIAGMVLSACGPGTGGTGTGPNVASSPGTFSSSYFTSGGADTTTVAPGSNPSTTSTASPSVPAAPCTGSCVSNQGLRLHVQADSVTLSSVCATFTTTGPWSVSVTGESTLQGVWESATTVNGQTSRTRQSASLTLQFTGDTDSSNSVRVTVKDSAGQLLLNPVTLLRASGAAPVAVTGGC